MATFEHSYSSSASEGSLDTRSKAPPVPARSALRYAPSIPNPRKVSDASTNSSHSDPSSDEEPKSPLYDIGFTDSGAMNIIFSHDSADDRSPEHPECELSTPVPIESLLFKKDEVLSPPTTYYGPPHTSISLPSLKNYGVKNDGASTPVDIPVWNNLMRRMSSFGASTLKAPTSTPANEGEQEGNIQWREMTRVGTPTDVAKYDELSEGDDVFSYAAALAPFALTPTHSPIVLREDLPLIADEQPPFSIGHDSVVSEEPPQDMKESSWMRRMSAIAQYLVAPRDEGDYYPEEESRDAVEARRVVTGVISPTEHGLLPADATAGVVDLSAFLPGVDVAHHAPPHAEDEATLRHSAPPAENSTSPPDFTFPNSLPAAVNSIMRRMSTAALDLIFPVAKEDDGMPMAKETASHSIVEGAALHDPLGTQRRKTKGDAFSHDAQFPIGSIRVVHDPTPPLPPRVSWARRMSSATFTVLAPITKGDPKFVQGDKEKDIISEIVIPNDDGAPGVWMRRLSVSMRSLFPDGDEVVRQGQSSGDYRSKDKGKAKQVHSPSSDSDSEFPIGTIHVLPSSPPPDPGPSMWASGLTRASATILNQEKEHDIASPGVEREVKLVKRVSFHEDPVGSVRIIDELTSPSSPEEPSLGASFIRRMSTSFPLSFLSMKRESTSAGDDSQEDGDIRTTDVGIQTEHSAFNLLLPKDPVSGAPRPSWKIGVMRRSSSAQDLSASISTGATSALEEPALQEYDPVASKARAIASLLSALDIHDQGLGRTTPESHTPSTSGSVTEDDVSPITPSFIVDVDSVSIAGASLPTPPLETSAPYWSEDIAKRLSYAGFGLPSSPSSSVYSSEVSAPSVMSGKPSRHSFIRNTYVNHGGQTDHEYGSAVELRKMILVEQYVPPHRPHM